MSRSIKKGPYVDMRLLSKVEKQARSNNRQPLRHWARDCTIAPELVGRTADEAVQMLRFLPNRSARLLEAVLKSALGNAEDRGARDIEELVVTEARVDDGKMLKRIMPRARGTAYPIKKRMSHIIITLA